MAKYSPSKYRKLDKDAIQLRIDYCCFSKSLDVFSLARKLGMVLIPYSSLTAKQLNVLKKYSEKVKDGFSIMGVIDGEWRCYTFYNDSVSPYRQRFTIAHEIKHFVYGETDPNDEQEDLANHFARYLMAPCCLVIPYVGLSPFEVADDFDISLDAASNALKAARNRSCLETFNFHDFERRFLKEVDKNLGK